MIKLLSATLFVLAMLAGSAGASPNPTAGKDVFSGKCVMCHGADGTGNTAMGKRFNISNLRSPEAQKRSDAELAGVITKGKNKMPAFEGKLTPDQIGDVIAHIRELQKQK